MFRFIYSTLPLSSSFWYLSFLDIDRVLQAYGARTVSSFLILRFALSPRSPLLGVTEKMSQVAGGGAEYGQKRLRKVLSLGMGDRPIDSSATRTNGPFIRWWGRAKSFEYHHPWISYGAAERRPRTSG